MYIAVKSTSKFFFEMLSFKRHLLSLVLSSSTDAYYEVLTLKIRKEQYVRKTQEGSWRNSSVGSMRQSNWTYQSCYQIVRVVVRGRGEEGEGKKDGQVDENVRPKIFLGKGYRRHFIRYLSCLIVSIQESLTRELQKTWFNWRVWIVSTCTRECQWAWKFEIIMR